MKPYGENIVLVERPIARFGYSITLGIREGTNIWVAKIGENQELEYSKDEPGVLHQPTMYLDENEVTALHEALGRHPVQHRGQAVITHLQDAVEMRDRLFAMVEKEWNARTEGRGMA